MRVQFTTAMISSAVMGSLLGTLLLLGAYFISRQPPHPILGSVAIGSPLGSDCDLTGVAAVGPRANCAPGVRTGGAR